MNRRGRGSGQNDRDEEQQRKKALEKFRKLLTGPFSKAETEVELLLLRENLRHQEKDKKASAEERNRAWDGFKTKIQEKGLTDGEIDLLRKKHWESLDYVEQAVRDLRLKRYREVIAGKEFTDPAVMRLSEGLGESLASSQKAQRDGDKKDNTKTQVRRFYNLVRVAHTSSKNKDVDSNEVQIKLRTLQAQIAYAVARKTISADFKAFFDESLEAIFRSGDLKKSLAGFVKFFEAFYAYFYFHTEVKPQ